MKNYSLQDIGLSKAEEDVYKALRTLGPSPSGRIIKETGLRKSTVYETINRLQEKGLVSFSIEKYVKQFEALPPSQLLEFIDEKKRVLEEQASKTKQLVKELEKMPASRPEAQAKVLTGIEGFKAMRRDILKHADKDHLLIGAISKENEIIPGFFEEWNKKRQQQNIKIKILHKASAKNKAMTKKEYMGKYFETKYLPDDIENPAVINIYGDRVVNVLWGNKQPICFMLINKEIATSYRKYFEHLWKISN